jgi:transposase
MPKYKQGEDRKQALLLPPSLEDYVDKDNSVRAIDAYVDILDTSKLGFYTKKKNSTDGQPPYSPKLMLKIYIYGYLNRVRSSRRLETEIKRNIEMIWLCSGLTPHYKTIANFRKDHPKALKKVFKEFTLLCHDLDLIEGSLVAVDGAYLRANASKNTLILKGSAKRKLNEIEEQIESYLFLLNTTDKEDSSSPKDLKIDHDINSLKKRKAKLEKELKLLDDLKRVQYNTTDSDAQVMSKPAHNLMAYNSQIAVDNKYKFIVATTITTSGSDKKELLKMANLTKEIVNNDDLIIVADKGYSSTVEIKKCIDANINILVPMTQTGQQQRNAGKYSKEFFIYDKDKECYICPSSQSIHKTKSTHDMNGRTMKIYRSSQNICSQCSLKEQCLGDKSRVKQIQRWEHQEIIDDYSQRLQTKEAKDIMKKRGSIVEHPFGTIKRMLGWDHFLVRGKKKVEGENALIMFTYNFKRLLNLIGIDLFRKLCLAIKDGDLTTIKREIAL